MPFGRQERKTQINSFITSLGETTAEMDSLLKNNNVTPVMDMERNERVSPVWATTNAI